MVTETAWLVQAGWLVREPNEGILFWQNPYCHAHPLEPTTTTALAFASYTSLASSALDFAEYCPSLL